MNIKSLKAIRICSVILLRTELTLGLVNSVYDTHLSLVFLTREFKETIKSYGKQTTRQTTANQRIRLNYALHHCV